MAFLGQEEQIREFQDRFRFLYAACFIGIGILTARLVDLQILNGDKMRQTSEENRIKRVKIAAPRGMIFDRNHKLLIDNRPAFDLEVIPQYLNESHQTKEVVALLSRIIHTPESDILDTLDKSKFQPAYLPIKVKTDLSRDEVAELKSWQIAMPGVSVEMEIKRTNIYGEVASHLLGYIGEVNPIELPTVNKNGTKYKLGDSIGKFGLEQRMEDTLRGIDGEELVEVDALGRRKLERSKGRVLSTNPSKAAVPGKNLILTIDQDLQQAATEAFGDKIGSVVAIDPRSGEVLSMLSRPSFDPTEFSRGIPTALWNKLLNNDNHPLRDKTIQDHYSPGSVFKTITAIAGLQEGVIDVHTRFHCPGSMKIGNRVVHCWKKGGHGDLNVVGALTQSCDIFFFKLAQKFKSVDDIAKWANHLGLGHKTGISLPREVPGLIPTEEWKKKRFNQPWNLGETLYVAIGQSFVLTTAIQLANTYAAIANGGTTYRPFLIKEVESYDGEVLKKFKPEIIDQTRLKDKTYQLIKEGLWGAVNTPRGTAYSQRLPGMDMTGKTGTAQVLRIASDKIYSNCMSLKFNQRHNGLFVAFAPLDHPVIAVAVITEHSCHGAAAAPVARAVIKTYLEKYFPETYGPKVLAARLKSEGQNPSMPATSGDEDESVVLNADEENLADPDEDKQPLPPPPAGPPDPTTPSRTEERGRF